eukprot:COSAG01_NODE_69459_length_261_cov_0.734568_1_plen_57_part_10
MLLPPCRAGCAWGGALTLACGAHHARADGMTAGGIDGSPADLSEQKLREMYLSPWQY